MDAGQSVQRQRLCVEPRNTGGITNQCANHTKFYCHILTWQTLINRDDAANLNWINNVVFSRLSSRHLKYVTSLSELLSLWQGRTGSLQEQWVTIICCLCCVFQTRSIKSMSLHMFNLVWFNCDVGMCSKTSISSVTSSHCLHLVFTSGYLALHFSHCVRLS